MAVVKVIEIIARSPKSWADAAQAALSEVTKTIEGVWSLNAESFLVRDEKRER